MHEGVYFLQDGATVDLEGMTFDRAEHLVPRHLLIMGLGRSGTTACAQIAQRLGFRTNSPNVYLEDYSLRRYIANNDPQGALAALSDWPAEGQRYFWKDPKIWTAKFDPFLDHLPPSVGLLYVFRDPLNIASRDVMLTGVDLLTRIRQAAGAANQFAKRLELVRNRNVALVSYEKLLLKPEVVIDGLARFLQISDPAAIEAAIQVVQPTPESYEAHFRERRRLLYGTTPAPAVYKPPEEKPARLAKAAKAARVAAAAAAAAAGSDE